MKNMRNKKKLIGRTIGVGEKRISIKNPEELKEAITRQDIRDLISSGAIKINPVSGTKKKEKGRRKRAGKIRMRAGRRKSKYIIRIRRLRKYIKILKKTGKINKEEFIEARKKIKAGRIHDINHLKESFGKK